MASESNSLALLAEVAAHLPQVVFLTDVATRAALYISPAVERICGVTVQEVLDAPDVWHKCLPEESLARVRQVIANLGDGRANVRVTVHHRQRGPRQVDLSLWPVRDADGVPTRLVGIAEDITDDLKARERELSLNDGLLQLIASLPDGVIVYRDVVLFCNATLRERYGFDPTGMSIQAVIDKMFVAEEQPAARRRLIEAMSGDSLVPVERRLRSSDGGAHPAELRTVTIPFGGGVARATLVRDLTERHALEAELAEANTTATLGRVAAGLTHELNNPLAVLLGQLELAVEELPVLQATVERLHAAGSVQGGQPGHSCGDVLAQLANVREHAEAAAAAARLVRSIMTDFRTLSLPSTSDPHRVSLAEVLQSTCQLVDARLPSGVQLTLQVDAAPPVLADEARLSQALAHLLVAAGLAVHRSAIGSGDLTMTLDTDAGEARVRLVAPLAVRLDLAMVQNVEQPLVGSVGLCASVLQSYGGRLLPVAREHYSGVEVRLPAAPAPTAAEAAPQPLQIRPKRGLVLVVDDDPTVALIMRNILNSQHDVVVETDSRRALQRLVEGQSFDAIVCDIMMPDVSGIELYSQLLQVRPEQAGRLVFITGGAFADDADQRLGMAGRPCLEKPIDLKRFRATVAHVVG